MHAASAAEFVNDLASPLARPARRRAAAPPAVHRDQSVVDREGTGAVRPVLPARGPRGRLMAHPAAAAAPPRRPRGPSVAAARLPLPPPAEPAAPAGPGRARPSRRPAP